MLWRRSIPCGSNYGWPNRPDISAAGLPGPANPVYILKHDTSDCLHASNTESIPPGTPAPVNFEVYHQPLFDNNHPTDLWVFNDLGTGKSLTNQAFNRVLHASGTQVTAQGHKYLYTCAPSNGDHAEEFTSCPSRPRHGPRQPAGPVRVSPAISTSSACGPLRWQSIGTDLTPGGRERVHQELPGSNLYFY